MRWIVGALLAVGLAGCSGSPAQRSQLAVVKSVKGAIVCVHTVKGDGFCVTANGTRELQGVYVGDCVDMTRSLTIPPAKIEVVATERCRQPHAAPTEAVLRVKVVTRGALSAAAMYTVTTGPNGVSNCEAAAKTGNSSLREFTVGAPATKSAPLYFEFRTVAFHGPARYEQRAVNLDSVLAVLDRRSVYFERTPNSRVSMTINQDGSGMASFTSFVSPDGRSLNGVATWRCETKPAT
jgi:hypothetical protein